MGLPNIGPLELIIILAIALLIVGPRRLPEMGSAFGRTIREFRKASTEITDSTSIAAEASPAATAQPNTLTGQATPNVTTPAGSASAASAGGADAGPSGAGSGEGTANDTTDDADRQA
jgi:sec-independent protein translocase protein TatA